MKNIFFTIFLVGISLQLLSQAPIPEISPAQVKMPQSPEVSAFMKYVDMPVNLYTGIPEVSIPLISISDGHIGTNLSLSYHAGGHKVGEVATKVGLGWKLNVGGMITRKVNDKPDVHDDPGYTHQYILDTYNNSSECGICPIIDDHDSEPDIYHFNINGLSGSFFLEVDSLTPVVSCNQHVSIVPVWEPESGKRNDIVKFTIQSSDGTKYVFEDIETTTRTYYDGPQQFSKIYTSAWYISEINNPNYSSEKIEFNYSSNKEKLQRKWDVSRTRRISLTGSEYCKTEDLEALSMTPTVITPKLTSITSDYKGYTINLIEGDERDDLESANIVENYNELDSIELIFNGTLLKGFALDHSYQGTDGRLLLNSLTEYGREGEEMPPYEFTYNNVQLPDMDSQATDHWGFYNNSSESLIPHYTAFDPVQNKRVFHPGTDKRSYLNYTKAGILEKIKYPTGGEAIYEYELNEFGYINGDPAELMDQTDTLIYDSLRISTNLTHSSTFTINEDETILDIRIKVGAYCTPDTTGGNQSDTCAPRLDIRRNGIKIYTIYDEYLDDNISPFNIELEDFMMLDSAGVYTIDAEVQDTVPGDYLIFEIKYQNQEDTLETHAEVGGLRIKSVQLDDKLTEPMTRYYSYNRTDSTFYSSGGIYALPSYNNGSYRSFYYEGVNDTISNCLTNDGRSAYTNVTDCNYVDVVGSNMLAFGGVQGSHVGYSHVTVHYGDLDADWRTINKFTSPIDYPDIIYTGRPSLSPRENGFKTGLKSSVIHYSDKDEKVKTEIYALQYKEFDEESLKVSPATYRRPSDNFGNSACELFSEYDALQYNKKFAYITGKIRIGFAQNNLIQEIHHFPDGDLKVDHEYDYDSDLRNLESYTITNSDGVEHTTKFYYYTCINLPKVLNKITKEVNDTIYEGQRITYGSFSGACRPELIETYMGDHWEEVGEFLLYDSNGNPKEFLKANYTHKETYTWDSLSNLKSKSYADYPWTFGYDSDINMLDRTTDIDLQSTYYRYDGLNRLKRIVARDSLVTTEYTYNFGNPGYSNIEVIQHFDGVASQTVKTYVDGLGRETKAVLKGYTPSGGHLITYKVYDKYGRVVEECDPRQGGCTTILYENSPLNRVLSTTASDWERSTEMLYNTNKTSMTIAGISYDSTTLFITSTANENGDKTSVYKDVLGRVVLSRRHTKFDNVDTEYKYNEKGDILLVQPPSGSAYSYTYNSDGLLASKTIPGGGTTNYTYNDKFQIATTTLPSNDVVRNYYNIYDQDSLIVLGSDPILEYEYYGNSLQQGEKGNLKTQTSYILNDLTEYVDSDYEYDDYGRVIEQSSTLFESGTDVTYFTLDQRDLITNQYRVLTKDTISETINYSTTYDHSGRIKNKYISTSLYTDSLVSSIGYLENDWVMFKKLGSDCLQKIDYEYNQRGWLTAINGDINKDGYEQYVQGTFEDNGGSFSGELIVLANIDELKDTMPTNILMEYSSEMIDDQSNPLDTLYLKMEAFINGANINREYTDTLTYNISGQITDVGQLSTLISDDIEDLLCIRYPGKCNSGSFPDKNWDDPIDTELCRLFREDCNTTPPIPTCTDDDLFWQRMFYEQGNSALKAYKQFNGNISWMRWNRPFENSSPFDYGFQYDGIDRLELANSGGDNNYKVDIEYEDLVGNIGSIYRKGIIDNSGSSPVYGVVDSLSFTYSGDRLSSVTENGDNQKGYKSGGNYSHDASGNMTASPSIDDISYNHLNLPKIIDIDGTKQIEIIYDATGYKWQKNTSGGTSSENYTIEYINGVEISDESGSFNIVAIYHNEGRLIKDSLADWVSEYVIRDHLGNTRVTFWDEDDDGSIDTLPANGEISQVNDYYPFGMNMDLENPIQDSDNKYLFNGKELNEDFELNWKDYGARWYVSSIGRFQGIDPVSSTYSHVSPYNYAENEPIGSIDLWGLQRIEINNVRDTDGNITRRDVTITGNVKVLNLSSKASFHFNGSLSRANQLNSKTFSTNYRDRVVDAKTGIETPQEIPINVKVNLEFKEILNINSIKSTDFISIIVDDIKKNKGKFPAGVASYTDNVSLVEAGFLSKDYEVLFHEIGHNLGLNHTENGKGLMGEYINGQKSITNPELEFMSIGLGASGAVSYTISSKNYVDVILAFLKNHSNSHDEKKEKKSGINSN